MFWMNGYQLHLVDTFVYCYTQITAFKNKDRISLLALPVTLDTAVKIIWPSWGTWPTLLMEFAVVRARISRLQNYPAGLFFLMLIITL